MFLDPKVLLQHVLDKALQIKYLSLAWCHTPIISVLWETEPGEWHIPAQSGQFVSKLLLLIIIKFKSADNMAQCRDSGFNPGDWGTNI